MCVVDGARLMALYQSLSDAFTSSLLPDVATAPSLRIQKADKAGRATSQKIPVKPLRTTAKPARHQPAAPRPPQESGNWLDDATAFFSEGSKALIDVIASMDVPFDSLASHDEALPATPPLPPRPPLRVDAWARAPVVEQHGFAAIKEEHCESLDDFESVDETIHRMVDVPWERWGGHKRAPSPPLYGDQDAGCKKLHEGDTYMADRTEREGSSDATLTPPPTQRPVPHGHHQRQFGDAPGPLRRCGSGEWDYPPSLTPGTIPAASVRATPFSEPASPAGDGGESWGDAALYSGRAQLRWKMSGRLARKVSTQGNASRGGELGANSLLGGELPSLGPEAWSEQEFRW